MIARRAMWRRNRQNGNNGNCNWDSHFTSSSSALSLTFCANCISITPIADIRSLPPASGVIVHDVGGMPSQRRRRRRRQQKFGHKWHGTKICFQWLSVTFFLLMALGRLGQCQNATAAENGIFASNGNSAKNAISSVNNPNLDQLLAQQPFVDVDVHGWSANNDGDDGGKAMPEVVTPKIRRAADKKQTTTTTTAVNHNGNREEEEQQQLERPNLINAVVVEQRRKLAMPPPNALLRQSRRGKRKRRRRIHSVSRSVNSQMANAPPVAFLNDDSPGTTTFKDVAIHQSVPSHRHQHMHIINQPDNNNRNSSNSSDQQQSAQRRWTSRVDSAEPFDIVADNDDADSNNNRVDLDAVNGDGRQRHTAAAAGDRRRMVLTNERLLERAVILVPTPIEHAPHAHHQQQHQQQQPKVLTAVETFDGVGSKLQFREERVKHNNDDGGDGGGDGQQQTPQQQRQRHRRISKRVEGDAGSGEKKHRHLKTITTTTTTTAAAATTPSNADHVAQRKNNNNNFSVIPLLGTVPTTTIAGVIRNNTTTNLPMIAAPTTTTTTTTTMVPWLRFPARHWQLPPPLLMARLRRFNKGDALLRKMGMAANGGGPIGIGMGGMPAENALIGDEMSFSIDDVDQQQKNGFVAVAAEEKFPMPKSGGKQMVNLRTKFPKNRETLKPIQLSKVDESDMDLLSPSPPPHAIGIGTSQQMKPIQRHPFNNQQQQQQQQLTPMFVPKPATFPAESSAVAFHHQKPVPIPTVPSTTPAPKLPQSPKQTNPIVPIQAPIRWPAHHSANISNINGTSTGAANRQQQNAAIQRSVPTHLNGSIVDVNNTNTSLNPNAKLELCCRRQNLPPTCQQFCNFDTFTQEKLLVALLGSQCPGKMLGKAFDCAHSRVDHSECCQRAGIHRINNGQCMVFCRTHIPTPPNVLGYVSCLSAFGTIKNCYRDHQLRHSNLFGD